MVRFEDFSWGAGVYLGTPTGASWHFSSVRLCVARAFLLGLKDSSVEIKQRYSKQTTDRFSYLDISRLSLKQEWHTYYPTYYTRTLVWNLLLYLRLTASLCIKTVNGPTLLVRFQHTSALITSAYLPYNV